MWRFSSKRGSGELKLYDAGLGGRYALWIPADAVAAESEERGRWALEIMAKSMGAETRSSEELDLEGWLGELDQN